MCKNCEKKWESNETKLARDKKSGNEEFEIIQDRADAPCTSTPEHLEIVVARQPTWMWRERERNYVRGILKTVGTSSRRDYPVPDLLNYNTPLLELLFRKQPRNEDEFKREMIPFSNTRKVFYRFPG